MAMRSAAIPRAFISRVMEASRRTSRYFSDGTGRVLGEEEKAAENVYIQKKERERLEKLRLKMEKEKGTSEKEKPEKKAEDEVHKG
ncbi:uncharacterized protein LOC131235234 [Magnolia sinica]|uniref:uncharacterized protein LOC131235234 n=1 Tax=Magnolia sinica TaxID=86752 RepID=UPI00265868F1|nr:uncharacterized protein LOC131235234 [Magnolia sinica]